MLYIWLPRSLLHDFQSPQATRRVLATGLLSLLFFFNLKTPPSILKEVLVLQWTLLVIAKIWMDLRPAGGTEERKAQAALIWGSVFYTALVLGLFNQWAILWFPSIILILMQRTLLWSSVLFCIGAVYLVHRLRGDRSALSPLRLNVLTAIFLIFLSVEFVQRVAGIVYSRHQLMGSLIVTRFHPEYFEAAQWCRANTPRDAVIIAPPYLGGFRAESHRSVYVSWDESSALFLAPTYAREYDRRVRQLGLDPFSDGDSAIAWRPTRDEILQVRRESGTDYLVIESPKLMAFPLVYQNRRYAVYDLHSAK